MRPIDRRSFLVASGALALGACGGSNKQTPSAATTAGNPTTSRNGYAVAQRFNQEVLVPGLVRLPISLASDQAILSDGPEVLNGLVINLANDAVVIPAISARRRRVTEGLVYWDFHAQLDTVGNYALILDGGTPEGGAIQINDPSSVKVPGFGQQLPPFDTPTFSDARDVDPICTRLSGGPCPFHDITLTEALSSGQPVAYLIGTPAHCEFGTCAPGLESLITAGKRLGDKLAIVHAEVYTDDTATIATPAVDAYSLAFEPVIWLASATGVIATRLDAIWDATELDEALDSLVQ